MQVLIKINGEIKTYKRATISLLPGRLKYEAEEIYMEKSNGVYECIKGRNVNNLLSADEALIWMLQSTPLDISNYTFSFFDSRTGSTGPR